MLVYVMVFNQKVFTIYKRIRKREKKNDEKIVIHKIQKWSNASIYWKFTLIYSIFYEQLTFIKHPRLLKPLGKI